LGSIKLRKWLRNSKPLSTAFTYVLTVSFAVVATDRTCTLTDFNIDTVSLYEPVICSHNKYSTDLRIRMRESVIQVAALATSYFRKSKEPE